jgi:hypothetical protein
VISNIIENCKTTSMHVGMMQRPRDSFLRIRRGMVGTGLRMWGINL